MYRERLVGTDARSESARRLQQLLLEYHDFRHHKAGHRLFDNTFVVADWQAERLKATHQDLYQHPGYHDGLEFLLTDLYAPTGMTRRDDNIDRVFPKMVKWLPDQQLEVLAGLVELNLITQQLDLELAELLDERQIPAHMITAEQYCDVYRASQKLEQRRRQVMLVADVGQQLDRYVRNRTLGWLLSMSRAPAEMADLSDLHNFLHRGYSAFRKMDKVDVLIERLVTREQRVMDNILNGHPEPFILPGDL
ncbi:FFLEELY motif protein [Marinobacter sp. KMM 10035]|uniref:FFLEELY motif protein n=1 Tax=Marinobacter sp. KMM 10035 TaxID=3134034 RepID=UPI00397BF4E9